jgi:hypothetical protein
METTPPRVGPDAANPVDYSDRGLETGLETVADTTGTDAPLIDDEPGTGGAAFPGDGSGATSGYGEDMNPGSPADQDADDLEDPLLDDADVKDDLDDDMA